MGKSKSPAASFTVLTLKCVPNDNQLEHIPDTTTALVFPTMAHGVVITQPLIFVVLHVF